VEIVPQAFEELPERCKNLLRAPVLGLYHRPIKIRHFGGIFVHDQVFEGATLHARSPESVDHVREIVRTYISEELLLGAPQEIGDDESLLDNGVLDSTGAVEMVAFLEKTFNFKVEDHEIGPENLETISRICSMIVRKTGSAQTA
jgi:acyl carrier protein